MSGGTLPRARRRRSLVPLLLSLVLSLGMVLGVPVRAAADGPTTFTNPASIAIPGDNTATAPQPSSPYPSTIDVSGMSGAVTKVTVSFNNLTHEVLNEVDAMVVAPDGATNLVVLSDVGGQDQLTTITDQTLTFDDSADNPVPAQVVVSTGTYKPTNTNPGGATDPFPAAGTTPSSQTTLAGAFTGLSSANGTWSLYVVDDVSGSLGNMAGGWSITITTEVSAVATRTVVTSSDENTTTGESVTFSATVRTDGGAVVDTGTVRFVDQTTGTALGSDSPNASGSPRSVPRIWLREPTRSWPPMKGLGSWAATTLCRNGSTTPR